MKQWRIAAIIAAVVVVAIAAVLYATVERSEQQAASAEKDQEPLGVGSSDKKSGETPTEDRQSGKEPSLPADYKPPYAAEPAIAALVDKRIPLNKRASPDMVSKVSGAVIKKNLKPLLLVLDDKQDHPSVRNNVLVLLRRSVMSRILCTFRKAL